MGIISVENTDRLYWLGRYSERVYTTLRLFSLSFDMIIDKNADSYADFCQKLEIPNIYTDSENFIERYCFDPEDPNSIYSNLIRAYDNSITLREEIGSEAVSYIQLAVYALQKAHHDEAPLVKLQDVIDSILAFWGIADDAIDSENVRNLIKIGKRVERLDLYARLHLPQKELMREIMRLSGRIDRTSIHYNHQTLDQIYTMIASGTIDYQQLVWLTESLIEG